MTVLRSVEAPSALSIFSAISGVSLKFSLDTSLRILWLKSQFAF